jgi:hypothetical protein
MEEAMTLDVRSLREWVADLFGRGRLSGGGTLGELDLTASPDLDPENDQQPGRHKAP